MIPSALASTSTYTVFLTGKTKCIEVEGDFDVLVIKHTSSYLYSLLCGTSQARKTVLENFFFLWKSHKIHDTRASVHVLQKQIMMHINQQANKSHRYTDI